LREYHASLEVQAAQLQSMIDQGENVRLAKKIGGKNIQNKRKKA
jgi:hypothetical protein